MLVIAGKTYVMEQRDACVASFEEFVRRTRIEPGCLDFVIAADPMEDNRVNISGR
jgi:quinol monooxygenase YgiN